MKPEEMLGRLLACKSDTPEILDDAYDELKRLYAVETEYKILLESIREAVKNIARSKT